MATSHLIKKKSFFLQIYLSVIRRAKFYLPKVGADAFFEALKEFGIKQVVERITGNNKKAMALKLTYEADNRDTVRVFEMMYEKSKTDGVIFDPLKLFS